MATKPTFNIRVLDRIKYERAISTWSDLALVLGISYTKLKNWRDGKSAPSFAETVMMAYRFKIPLQEMTVESDEELRDYYQAA